MPPRTLSLRHVTFAYGPQGAVLDCPALDLGPGLTLLVGPNGAGKSTLLRLAAGVERPATGTVTVDGHDLWRDEVAARRGLAYVPEHPDLTPYATVREVVRLVAALRGEPARAAAEALSRAGLDELADRSVRELSMGQRRRALLAAALVGRVTTALLDEPLEAMDARLRALVLDWVGALCDAGAVVVVATHQLEPFAARARRAVCLTGGVPAVVDPLPDAPDARRRVLEACARGEGSPAG